MQRGVACAAEHQGMPAARQSLTAGVRSLCLALAQGPGLFVPVRTQGCRAQQVALE
jgi:hypothetical protein